MLKWVPPERKLLACALRWYRRSYDEKRRFKMQGGDENGVPVIARLPGLYRLVIIQTFRAGPTVDYVHLTEAWPWLGRQGLCASIIKGIWLFGDALFVSTRK